MRVPKKRCAHCHKWFQPDPRTTSDRGSAPPRNAAKKAAFKLTACGGATTAKSSMRLGPESTGHPTTSIYRSTGSVFEINMVIFDMSEVPQPWELL